MDKHDTLVCKSIADLYQVKAYKELKKIEINTEDETEQWPVIKNDAFKGMKNLDVIFIRGNISHLEPYALRGIEHPFKLVLIDNTLEQLPEELFNGVPVFLVGLATTHLKQLKPKWFKNTPLLKEFHIYKAKLTEAKAGIFSNTDIAIVELSSNEISTIEDGAFSGMKKLYSLNLRDNKLTTFDVEKVLGSSTTIELLYLSENLLTTISTFPTLPKMRAMAFEKNAIATIESKCFANLKNLEIVELSFNKLKSIPPATLPGRLQRLGVGENPWTCSYLTGLEAWANKSNVELFCGDSFEPCTISCV
ncbi:tollo [Carabus blaptoides fortunei]